MCKFSKFTLGALVASSITSSACANWYDNIFAGVEADYNFASDISLQVKNHVSISPFNGNMSDDAQTFGFGAKLGYDFDIARVYGAYNHNFKAKADTNYWDSSLYSNYISSGEIKWNSNDFILGADYTPKFSISRIDFKAVLGAFGGLSKIDIKHEERGVNIYGLAQMQGSLNGFIYGLRLGSIYEINKNNEVEFGFKFSQAKYSDKDTTINVCNSMNCFEENLKLSDTKLTNKGVFVGYNYKF